MSWTNPLDTCLLLKCSFLLLCSHQVSPLQAQDPGTHQGLSLHTGCWCLPGLTRGLLLRAHFPIQTQIKAVVAGSGQSQIVPSLSSASFLQRKSLNFLLLLFGIIYFFPKSGFRNGWRITLTFQTISFGQKSSKNLDANSLGIVLMMADRWLERLISKLSPASWSRWPMKQHFTRPSAPSNRGSNMLTLWIKYLGKQLWYLLSFDPSTASQYAYCYFKSTPWWLLREEKDCCPIVNALYRCPKHFWVLNTL